MDYSIRWLLVSHDLFTHTRTHTLAREYYIYIMQNQYVHYIILNWKFQLFIMIVCQKVNHLTVVISIWLQTHSVNEQRQLISTHTIKKLSLTLTHTYGVIVNSSNRKQVAEIQMERWKKRHTLKHRYAYMQSK